MPVNISKATIAARQSLSGAADCSAGRIVQINTPDAWDPANITFQISPDGVTWDNLYLPTGEELMLTCQPNRAIAVKPTWPAAKFVKVRSGPAAAQVMQSALRDFEFVVETA